MKKIAPVVFLLLCLVSCTSRRTMQLPINTTQSIPPSTIAPVYSSSIINNPVFLLPKIKTIDWSMSLSHIVQQMLQVDGINNGSVLLVNTFKNATNGNIQTNEATAALVQLIADSGEKFKVVSPDKLSAARKKLVLSVNDNLELRSKAVGLARYLNAQYVLYSTVIGDVKAPMLNLQLMLVHSGEIIWFANDVALYLR